MSFLPAPEHLQTLSGTEYHILEYIVKNQYTVSKMTVQELAEKTYISTASIMRFCKKLGFSGFSELKFHLKSDKDDVATINSNQSIADIKKSILMTLGNTSNYLKSEDVENVAKLLHSDRKIHFFAKGISSCVFSYFQKYLQTLGRHSTLYEDTHIAYLNVERMTENDVLFVTSVSGVTAQIIKAVQIASAKGAIVVAFTGTNNTPLSTLATFSFFVSKEEVLTHSFDTESRLSMYYIVDLIIKKYLLELK